MASDSALPISAGERAAALRNPSSDMGEAKFLDVGGIRTRYFDKGKGAPVVFFHGGNFGAPGGSSTARVWERNFVPLATRLNAISVDRLGQGYTDNPKTDADYTMHAVVQHAAAFLKSLGKGPYHLAGHSRGGYVVCRLTMEFPELAKSCIIVSSGTLAPGTPHEHIIHAHPPVPRLSREGVRWGYERYSYNPKIVTEEWIDDTYAAAITEKNRAAIRKMVDEGLAKKLFLPQLGRQKAECHRWIVERGMPCPTLLVWGFNDPSAQIEAAKRLLEMLVLKQRRTEMRIFNKAGHFVYREHPEAFNGMLLDYVRQNG